jgi:quercetin dioxygenase-like cupin family protein
VIRKTKLFKEVKMKKRGWVPSAILVAAVVGSFLFLTSSTPADEQAVAVNSAELKFANLPGLPTCFTAAVESGDPVKGPSVFMIKGAAGCKVPWHWHTPAEHVMIVSGTGRMEMQGGKTTLLRPGGYALLPSHHIHQFSCAGPCSIFLRSDGVFDMHYVDKSGKEITPEQALGSPKMKPAAKKK